MSPPKRMLAPEDFFPRLKPPVEARPSSEVMKEKCQRIADMAAAGERSYGR